VNAKYAFKPRPADKANGVLEKAAIQKHAIAEDTAVAVKMEPASMPE